MSKHDAAAPPAAAPEPAASLAEARRDASPAPMVTLIGGPADGRRIPRPAGSSVIVRAGARQEFYILSRAHLSVGMPVEFWHVRFLPPAEALARALDAYPRFAADAA